MFLSPFTSLCFAAVVLAGPYKHAHTLSVALSSPSSSVHSIADLVLTAAVTNRGPEDIKVLKYATILDAALPTRSFTKIFIPDTHAVLKLSISLTHAGETAYTTISAGKTSTVAHNVSALFDFASVDPGSFTFAPVKRLQIAHGAQKISVPTELTTIDVSCNPITIAVTGDVAPRTLVRRAPDTCTNASQKKFIDARFGEGAGVDYITSRGASDSLYKSYWGTLETSRVISILDAVANENSKSRNLSCVDPFDVCPEPGVIAYTDFPTNNIYFCGPFFDEQPTTSLCSGTTVESTDIRGGTTLHEAYTPYIIHPFEATLIYVAYGCRALSADKAIQNADNFECFATKVYANTKCQSC
ncbi:hypothetical protein C8R44DRAFT_611560 [Mycena epipterygia]|nr:hypothetical protein C8R44DRAFT_611560 [Mycena epipterygia]